MVSERDRAGERHSEPADLAGLNLPPTFVVDHCIRTLSYRGALSPLDLAKHWRVHPDIGLEVAEILKQAGLVVVDAGSTSYERHGRLKLTAAGLDSISNAMQRTWYAGALPISLKDFATGVHPEPALPARAALREALAAIQVEESVADEIGSCLSGHAVLLLSGLAPEEQHATVRAIGSALEGDVTIPYALYAAGAIVRVFDGRYHYPRDDSDSDAGVLKQHDGQWARVGKPTVVLAGGAFAVDALPSYDAEAKFYLAPAPFAASGGLLAVLDAGSRPADLSDLAALWLIPGQYGAGTILLRSGERIEVPWRASTMLLSDSTTALDSTLRALPIHRVDASSLQGAHLRGFLADALAGLLQESRELSETVATLLESLDLATRAMTSRMAGCLRARAAYEGSDFEPNAATLQSAIDFAREGGEGPTPRARRAA